MHKLSDNAPAGYPDDGALPRRGLADQPGLAPEQIARLVDRFYAEIRRHPRLGPIFERRLAGQWDSHLARMTQFWESILLQTGTFKGRPVPVHLALADIRPDDYPEWLAVFRPVAREVFGPEAAGAVIERAERIATTLQAFTFLEPTDLRPGDARSCPDAGASHA
ncbi:group III truncated hemoglobin [Pannonibacter tanglangensis]|uniref:Preprotein translocase subunit TatC n=1 Tax=Pannonibacter tanglangensis TaxID=2750084 RepID=A0ABW9ZKN9_9HYPH|nr:group III truncated hemoglobin [Pannonibacter sp. XCT-34]NBN64492.1 preprotein translocase subunit TatC [Pannonibacter sp. XCT-34]